MKYLFFVITTFLFIRVEAQNDSINTIILSGVSVTAKAQIETPEKVIFIPTTIERNHTANAFDLIYMMNAADLDVSPQNKQITTHSGGEVVLCVNGIEMTADEVASLRSKSLISIEFVRHPTGKYAGKAGLLNIKTVQYKYGGNVYLSAMEGFAYKNGDYLASADYTIKNTKLSFTYSNSWGKDLGKSEKKEDFYFTDGRQINKSTSIGNARSKQTDNILNVRLSGNGKDSRYSLLVGGTVSDMPYKEQTENVVYQGSSNETRNVLQQADSKNLSSWMEGNYILWLKKEQILDFTGKVILGRNKYNSLYEETQQGQIISNVKENNFQFLLTAQYYKTFKDGLQLVSVLNHYTTNYTDHYLGNISSQQHLRTGVSLATVQLSKSAGKLYWYANVGVSNMNVVLNDDRMNYCNPTSFYGLTFTPMQKLSFALNGYYVHTLFDPSNKNDVPIQTSFCEVTQGNPNLKPLKVLSNMFDVNAHLGKTDLSLSYQYYIYFDNILHQFTADNSYIYNMSVNDGNFYGNMICLTVAQRFFNDKLRCSATGIEEYNTINGDIYNISRNVIRGKLRVDYILNKLRFSVNYTTPSKALDIREPYIIKKRMNIVFSTSWDYNAWHLEAIANNPFTKYAKVMRNMDYGCYNMDKTDYTTSTGRNIMLKAVYNFSYGKKTSKEEVSNERTMNSAILKSY